MQARTAIIPFVLFVIFAFLNEAEAGSPGSSAAVFLNYSPGSRGSGMADAFSAASDDAYSSYFNPAGLAGIETLQFGASYNASIEDISHQYAVLAYPDGPGRVFSLSYSGLSYGSIAGYDATGAKTKNINAGDRAVGFSYGKALTKDEIERPVLSGGATLKYIMENLDSASANTFALDLGAIYVLRPDNYWLSELPAQEFRFSALLKNAGPGLKFDKTNSPLPTSFVLGSSWHSHPKGAHDLILSLDNVFPVDDGYKIALGAEYFLFQLVGVRVGYETDKDIGSKIRFGIGFKLSFLDIDYSMTPFGELGSMQKIGLMARFGNYKAVQPLKGETARAKDAKMIAPKEKIEKLEIFAEDFIKLAEKDLEDRNFVSAGENFQKAFNLKPELKKKDWGRIAEKLSKVTEGMKLRKMPEKTEILKKNTEESALAAETIKAFINGENQKAYLLAHITYGTGMKSELIYEELLNFVCDSLRMSARRDEMLPKKSWGNQKLKKSANFFYLRQFDMVIKECEEILLIDENNYLAWTRLGSAYFMLGDKEKAKNAYLKALEINPNDQMTIKFMKARGWK